MMIGTLSAQGSSFSHCNEATKARENQSTKSISAKQSDEEIPLVAFRSIAAQSYLGSLLQVSRLDGTDRKSKAYSLQLVAKQPEAK